MPQSRILDFQGSPAQEVVIEKVERRQRFTIETLLRAKRARDDHLSRSQAEKEAVILHLLGSRTRRAAELYMAYVGACAEKGWPIVTDRQFRNYLTVLQGKGRVLLDVESQGRGGRFTLVTKTTVHQTSQDVQNSTGDEPA